MKNYTKDELDQIENLDEYLVKEIKKFVPNFKRVKESDYTALCYHYQAQSPDFEKKLEEMTCNVAYDCLRHEFLMRNFELDPRNFEDVLAQGYIYVRKYVDYIADKLPKDFKQYVKSIRSNILNSFADLDAERRRKNADLNDYYKKQGIVRDPKKVFSDHSGVAEKSRKPIDPQNAELVR